jgi:hypothetical protein
MIWVIVFAQIHALLSLEAIIIVTQFAIFLLVHMMTETAIAQKDVAQPR